MYAILKKLDDIEALEKRRYRSSHTENEQARNPRNYIDPHKTLVMSRITGEFLYFSVAPDGSTTLTDIRDMYNLTGKFICAGKLLNETLPIREAGRGLEDGPDLRTITIGSIYYVGDM